MSAATRKEFTCDCGIKCRVDCSIEVAAIDHYQHCGQDKESHRELPGPIIAVWEERNGKWVLSS
jgi:hypothetical protein